MRVKSISSADFDPRELTRGAELRHMHDVHAGRPRRRVDAHLHIDEFDVRFVSLDQFGRFAEHVSSAQRLVFWETFLVLSFGQARVLDRRGTEPLADFQRTRTRHDGVYATPGHKIASEEDSHD